MVCCTVRRFLCCMSLEAGGLIIGWFNIIVQFFILFGIISLMSLAVVAYNEGNNPSNDDVIGGFVTLMIVYSFYLLFTLIVFMAAIMLVIGTSRKDHTKMMLFMIIMAVGVIFEFITVFIAGWSSFWWALFWACLSLYWYICVYSLYCKIRSESEGRPYA